MAITEKQLSDGQEVISLLEISLLKLKRALLQKNAGEVLFVRKVPVRGTSEVPKELELLIPQNSKEALCWAADCLTSTRLVKNQNPKETSRCFGVIKVTQEVIDFAETVNIHKAKFKEVIDNIYYKDRRYLYRSIPNFNAVQAMRLIEFVKGERKVTYRWASAPGVTQISKAQLVEKILHELSSHLGYRVSTSQLTKNSDDSQIIEAAYDLEALSVVKNPDEALAISRKIMPHVRSYFAKSKRRLTSTAPYLTLNEITIEAKSLDDYSKCFEPSDSESVIETIPLIEHLNVYRYIPSKRKNMKVKASKSTSRMRGGNYLEI